MNSLVLFVIVCAIFVFGYSFFQKTLNSLFETDDSKATPAHTKRDGCDYVPASHWTVLFGHHFSSIAGAGPIIGPVLGVVIWGWVPALLWIVIGTLLIGGIHDFGSLMVSVKNSGSSIADVTEKLVSKRAKILFGLFVWLSLILVNAVFIVFAAKTFQSEPAVVVPALGLIPVSVIVGYMLYYRQKRHLGATIFGLASLFVLILVGSKVSFNMSMTSWSVVLLVYCYVSSVTPVNILLQPRDYLSGYLLSIGIIFGTMGIIITRYPMQIPAFNPISAASLPMWPMLFVTVACGAISGFHSMVASGTTSKQLDKESHGYKIGYGSMVLEGILATIALVAVAGGISLVDAKGFISNADPMGAFALGFGRLTFPFLGTYGKIFALLVLNAFVLTTLDSATRITRYLTAELFGLKNRYFATLIVVISAGGLALNPEIGKKIWPVFGASNQLVAALTLIVISAWLLKRKKTILYTIIPAFFMLITTFGALVYQSAEFFKKKAYLLVSINVILIFLSVFLLIETVTIFVKKKKQY